MPGKELGHVKHGHHWREGNLPQSSKCAHCKKTCWSSECLTGNTKHNGFTLFNEIFNVSLNHSKVIVANGVVLQLMVAVVCMFLWSVHSACYNPSICHHMPSPYQERKCQWKPLLVFKCETKEHHYNVITHVVSIFISPSTIFLCNTTIY